MTDLLDNAQQGIFTEAELRQMAEKRGLLLKVGPIEGRRSDPYHLGR